MSGSAPSTDVEPTNCSASCELLMDNNPKLELWLSKGSIKEISPSLASVTSLTGDTGVVLGASFSFSLAFSRVSDGAKMTLPLGNPDQFQSPLGLEIKEFCGSKGSVSPRE